MAEISLSSTDELSTNSSSEIVLNQSSEIHDTPSLTTNPPPPTTTSVDLENIDEPPSKKCKIQLVEKPRLLEDRLGSILSCCICLDLSTLAMFQVNRYDQST